MQQPEILTKVHKDNRQRPGAPEMLTPSTPAVRNRCCLQGSAPYWSNPPFFILDIRALSSERQSARMSKIKNDGLDQYGTV